MRVSPHIRNGNEIKFIDDKLNVVAMSRSPNCVFQPKIQKGKAPEKVVHPYSRKAAYLAREETRLKRKERWEWQKTHLVLLQRQKTGFCSNLKQLFKLLYYGQVCIYIFNKKTGDHNNKQMCIINFKIHLNALSKISQVSSWYVMLSIGDL